MIYAVIDTNVIIAAAKSHKPDSSTSRIIGLVNAGVIRPLVCREILEEYIQTLNLPILAIPAELSMSILSTFIVDGIYMERVESHESFPDPTDQVFYEIALSVEDAYLVTNNIKHFPKRPLVVTPSEMLLILSEQEI